MPALYGSAHEAGGTATDTVVVSGIEGGNNQFYVAYVAVRAFSDTISSVTGGGLTWTHRKTQVARRQNHALHVYTASGTPTGDPFSLTVVFSDATGTRDVAVVRVTGADMDAGYEGIRSWNTVGEDGTNGSSSDTGLDTSSVGVAFNPSADGSCLVFGACVRGTTVSSAAADFSQRALANYGAGGEQLRLYAHTRDLATAGSSTPAHTLTAAIDWAAVTVIVKPAVESGPEPGVFPETSVLDAFGRADGSLGANWVGPVWADDRTAQVVGNAMGDSNTAFYAWSGACWSTQFEATGHDEVGSAIPSLPGINGGEVYWHLRLTGQGAYPTSYALHLLEQAGAARRWRLFRVVSGAFTMLAELTTGQSLDAGDSVGLRARGSNPVVLEAFHKPSAGDWADTPFLSASDFSASRLNPTYSRVGAEWETQGTATRLDDFFGGTVASEGPPPGDGGSAKRKLLLGVG